MYIRKYVCAHIEQYKCIHVHMYMPLKPQILCYNFHDIKVYQQYIHLLFAEIAQYSGTVEILPNSVCECVSFAPAAWEEESCLKGFRRRVLKASQKKVCTYVCTCVRT